MELADLYAVTGWKEDVHDLVKATRRRPSALLRCALANAEADCA